MIRILHVGLGPLGKKMVEAAVLRGFEVVGGADIAPDFGGKPLGDLCPSAPENAMVFSDIAQACTATSPDVAVVTTVSSLSGISQQISVLAAQGIPIISTCEELSYPWEADPKTAGEIDSTCRDAGVPCLGTGVNPGYLMDYLPTVLTAPSARVDAIRVWRVQNAATRRVPFQKKIGAGLGLNEFELRRQEGVLRHVGLRESVGFIASRMGWSLDDYSESLEPVVAESDLSEGYAPISAGQARGVKQVGTGFSGGAERIVLTFVAAVGEKESYERVSIEGIPRLEWRCDGGINGNIATCAITLNAIRSLLAAEPGLRTMGDVHPVTFGPPQL